MHFVRITLFIAYTPLFAHGNLAPETIAYHKRWSEDGNTFILLLIFQHAQYAAWKKNFYAKCWLATSPTGQHIVYEQTLAPISRYNICTLSSAYKRKSCLLAIINGNLHTELFSTHSLWLVCSCSLLWWRAPSSCELSCWTFTQHCSWLGMLCDIQCLIPTLQDASHQNDRENRGCTTASSSNLDNKLPKLSPWEQGYGTLFHTDGNTFHWSFLHVSSEICCLFFECKKRATHIMFFSSLASRGRLMYMYIVSIRFY